MPRKKGIKKSVKNIINNGWNARRDEYAKKSFKNSERTKEWKAHEKEGLVIKRREKHFLNPPPKTTVVLGPSKPTIVTLSLLVGVTYAPQD
jgi:hypothetical protein